MGNKKIKEDDKTERTIRALLKLPENKRCINCNLLGPQYVCTTFWTFVCTTCSGIHREFTHRVKPVSMAKFSEEEVNALQAAGNERARQIYFKAWDPQRNSLPDGSNLHRLRDFIKHVYVERKYAGERRDRLPSVRLGHRAGSPESRKVSVFSGISKSPLYEDRHEWSSNEGSSPAGRSDAVRGYYNERSSPRFAQEDSRYGGFRRNPLCIEIVDNRLRSDGCGSARRQNKHIFSHREPMARSGSSDHQKNMDRSVSPVVRPVRDILGENAPTLQVGEHSKANAGRDPDGSAINQKIASSGGMESLIDFSTDSEPSNAVAAPDMQQVPPSNDAGDQSSDELSSKDKAPPASSANSLEFLLFDLSTPSVEPVDNVSAVPGTTGAPSTASGQSISVDSVSPAATAEQILALTSIGFSTMPPVINVLQKPSNVGPLQATTHINGDYRVKAPEGQQKHQSSMFSVSDNCFTSQQSNTTVEASHSQLGTSLLMLNAQQSSNVSIEQSFQGPSKSAEETSYEVRARSLSAETKSSGRKELPEDLFTTSYASAPAAVPGWQYGLQHGMGFGMQYYPNAVHAAAFRSTAKANPFDLNSETTPEQARSFPSMASLPGGLPSVQAPTGLSDTTSFDAHSLGMTSHSSYLASLMTPESPCTLAMPSNAYMGDQPHIGVPPSRPQVIGGLGSDEFSRGSVCTTQEPTGGHSASNSPLSFPKMGANPFG
ncbi:ArfGap/RecO-like zinc finger domain-containing protein, putative [Theobroma cacao]|uniref:ArfGap/RecO-like zinc finger domain-containing protein, putative n=1 Tax=Theobroma cacao TaxID=3641 RepID=A0A061GNA9_THECC|nr:ArfGap/RecO-like zinc finger domain-containing protein, putative [Theobroma cacao]